jgi:hypothetical protein
LSLHVPQDKTKCHICKWKAPDTRNCVIITHSWLADPEVREELLTEELDLLIARLQDAAIDANADKEDPKMYVRQPGEVRIESDNLDIDFQPYIY